MIAALGTEAGKHEIADAAEPPKRLAIPSHGNAKTRHLGQCARHQSRARILTQPEAVGDAGSQCKDVLECPAQLDPPLVPAGVGTEIRSFKQLLNTSQRLRARGADDTRRRNAPSDLPGQIRTRENRDGGIGKFLR